MRRTYVLGWIEGIRPRPAHFCDATRVLNAIRGNRGQVCAVSGTDAFVFDFSLLMVAHCVVFISFHHRIRIHFARMKETFVFGLFLS